MRLSDQFQHEDEAAFLSVANLTSAVPLPPKVGTSEIQSLKDYELCRDDGPVRLITARVPALGCPCNVSK